MRKTIFIAVLVAAYVICGAASAPGSHRGLPDEQFDKSKQDAIDRNLENRQMIDELRMSLMNLPDRFDGGGWGGTYAYIYILGKRGAVEARGIFERYLNELKRLQEELYNSEASSIKASDFRFGTLKMLEESILRLEIAEKGNISDENKLRILLKKLEMELKRLDMKFEERGKDPVNTGPIIEVICDLPPDLLIPEMFKLLDGDNERLKSTVLRILGRTGFGGEQKRVIDFMEAEINKPGYGLYFYGQYNLGKAGDAEAYRYLKEKLKSPDPVIRENTITAIGQFYDRKIIDVDEFQSTLTPLLKDEDKNVSEKATSMLRLNDFIKPHK